MLNDFCGIGRLVRDPELRYTGSNKAATTISLAIERDGKNKDGEYDVDYIDCVAYEKTAELLCKYCTKGQQIGIQGRLQQRRWKDADGKTKSMHEILVRSFFLLGRKENETKQSNDVSVKTAPEPTVEFTDDVDYSEQLPF